MEQKRAVQVPNSCQGEEAVQGDTDIGGLEISRVSPTVYAAGESVLQ